MNRVVIVFLCLIAIGCNKLTEGIIINKFYEPERRWTTYEYDYSLKMYMTKHHKDSEDWVFIIEGTYDGEPRTERREVTEYYYSKNEVGDFVILE